jgi:signal peptidase II
VSQTDPGRVRISPDSRLFLAVAGVVLVVDQVTKAAVRAHLAIGQRWPGPDVPLSRYFTITHVSNTGVSFGMGQGQSDAFSVLSLAIIAVLLWYRRKAPAGATWLNVALGLQVGGALGNLVDRVTIGHVTDFLDFQFWPVFNVADSSIFVGVLLLAWHVWTDERSARKAEEEDAQPDADAAAGGLGNRPGG